MAIVTALKKLVKEHTPEIFSGVAVVGVICTAVAWYKETPKIKSIMRDYRKDIDELESLSISEEEYKAQKKEIVKHTALDILPTITPPIIITTVTIMNIIISNRMSAKKLSAAVAAYEVASYSLRNLKQSIRETIPKKEREVLEHAIERRVQEDAVPAEGSIYSTKHGDVLCKDLYTKVYFRSCHEEIRQAIRAISREVRHNGWCSLSELYGWLGVRNIPPIATDIGWRRENLIEGEIPATITTCWDESGSIPVIGLDYEVDPYFEEGGRFRRA